MFQLTELQMRILQVLWERGSATVSDVRDALEGERGLAPTTIATLLTRLEKRGLLDHDVEGRTHVYRAVVSEQEVRTNMVETLRDKVFGGDMTALVSHLLDARELEPGDLARVRDLLTQMEVDAEESE